MGGGKIVFADHLRGLAALSVLVSHIVVPYAKTFAINYYVNFSILNMIPPIINKWIAYFDFGPFGVAIFFLISGFVVPMSFKRHSARSFIFARVLRIWPTYLIALALSLAAEVTVARLFNTSFAVSFRDIIANVFLVQDFVGVSSIDGVNWTLTIEVFFYGILVIIYPILPRYRAWVVVFAASVLPIAITLENVFPAYVQLDLNVVKFGTCVPFMLTETVFYLRWQKLISFRVMLCASIFSVYAVSLCLIKVLTAPTTAISYIAAFIIFFCSYVMRERFGANNILTGLSAISYPLYLVHSAIGVMIIRVATVYLRFGDALALAAAIIVALAVACALHFAVERPTMALGSRLAPRPRREVANISILSESTK